MRGEWGVSANAVSFWGNENVLELVVMVVQPHQYTKQNPLNYILQHLAFYGM